MGKEVVLFKDTREKAEPKREKRDGDSGGGNSRFAKRMGTTQVKKNISKKQADKRAGYKNAERVERLQALSHKKGQDEAIKKLQRGNQDLRQRKEKIMDAVKEKRQQNKMNGSEWEDVDEHEKEVFAKTGYYDVPDTEQLISNADQKMLEQMESKNTSKVKFEAPAAGKANKVLPPAGERTLHDLIMFKMQTGDYVDENIDPDSISQLETQGTLDQKVIAAYKKVGVVMRSYKSGKLPKAFKIIPQTQNWEDLLALTEPSSWSANSSYEATKMFCSQMNAKMTQRFYNIILLPNVCQNIVRYKKLNYHLYMAVKKAMFKTGAFFKGFLLPLAEIATTRDAIIIGSILQKMSINPLDVAAALMKLTSMDYKLGNGYFLKVLLGKRYTLPTMALDAIINYFCKTGMQDEQQPTGEDEEEYDQEMDVEVSEMPVMWHQTMLSLVQCYKSYFSREQKNKIKALIKVQNHYAITGEIRREMNFIE